MSDEPRAVNGWALSDNAHVMPVNDLKAHYNLMKCWCHPTMEQNSDDVWVAVHHSADGREDFERKIRKMS